MNERPTLITNGATRDLLYWHDLTPAEQADLSYLDTEDKRNSATFFRYRGALYDLAEFSAAPADLAPFAAYSPDSYFSGVVWRYPRNAWQEGVIVGRYYS